MIFVSGVHGVGKTYFCNLVKEKCSIDTYTASDLISEYKKQSFSNNKRVEDIENNQTILINAIHERNKNNKEFILDGHFCLLDSNNNIQKISLDTYKKLNPTAIVLLTEEDNIIKKRRKSRDNMLVDENFIHDFQNSEKEHAEEVTKILEIPLFITYSSNDIEDAINFIKSIIRGKNICQESSIG